jgi:hypothetical protein
MGDANAVELRVTREAHAAELKATREAHAAELTATREAHAVELRATREAHVAERRAAMTPASASASPHRRRARSPAADAQAEQRAMTRVIGAVLNCGRAAARAAVGIFCPGRANVRDEPGRRGGR